MISVILPALNEEEGIVRSLELLKGVALGEGSEILVVDDGSADRTGERALELGARVLRHVTNQGYGRSLKDGIAAATHDTIVIADADGSYPFDRIPSLVEEFGKGFDMVVGIRESFEREPAFKRVLRFVLKHLVEFTAGTRVPDVNSGMRVFSKGTISKELSLLSNGFSFTTSLTLCYLMTGRFVTHVPIDYRSRVGRSKVRLLRDSLRTLQFIVQAMVYYNPLKAFLLPCIACLLLSGGALLAALVGLEGALSLAFQGLLAAILIFSLGLFAVMVRQSSDE
jgi:glycosyltransferase involved in cell wall biosynthesis